MTKWMGLEGTAILAQEREAELLERYPFSITTAAKGFEKYLPILPEAATALKSGATAMHDMRNGGVFGGLYELAGRLGVGLSIDLKKIPVKQETIEICEFFDLNPYGLLSGGSLLIVAEDGDGMVKGFLQLSSGELRITMIKYCITERKSVFWNRQDRMKSEK